MHSLIPPASKLLGLPTPTSSNKSELTDTILSELLPDIPEDQSHQTSLQTLGHNPTAVDTDTTTNFLFTTLLAQRILQHEGEPPKHEKQDEALADALSRLTLALSHSTPSVTSATLPSYITSLVPYLPAPSRPLSPPLNPDQVRTLQGIQSRLHAEHLTRVELLLTRLGVTISAFSRSKHAPDHVFEYERQMASLRRQAEAVSLYQAVSATEALLKEPKRVTDIEDVKNFIMGSVPDRGGRLQGPFMPAFRGRIPSGVERKAESSKRKSKGKGKNKGKRR